MVKSATITVEEGGPDKPAVAAAAPMPPVIAAAKAEAIRTTSQDKRAVRQRLYSNDNWQMRRKVIYASLVFFAVLTAYLVFLAPDDELRRSMALPVVGAFVSIILGYAGFAVVDDNNKRSTMAVSDAVPPPEE